MLERALRIQEQLIAWRRDIHMHPELGFRETRTAALVAGILTSLGYRVRSEVGRTGVVGERGEGRPVVAVRADMDALPIKEANDVPYASQVAGTMHACGHDAHTAIALGVAALLAQEEFPGAVRLLFQPAEEVSDAEGLSGAPRMVEDGAMDGVEAVLALHVNASIPVGDIAVEAGASSAGVDSFLATITGKGAHGAYPHRGLDPIHISGHVILALHGIVSRRVNPFEPAVITVGSIHAGHANNVIPEEVDLSGTIRYENPEVQRLLHEEIERALGIARAFGGDYRLAMHFGSAPVLNDPQIVDLLRQVGASLLGAGHVIRPEKGMGAEDFSVFTDLAPGAMFRLGCRIDGDERKAHGPRFDIDERCLPVGAAVLAEATLRLLRSGSQGAKDMANHPIPSHK